MADEATSFDDRKRRCPMLGHDVPFVYCRTTGAATPCRRVFDCWRETFDVEAFLKPHLTSEQLAHIAGPRPDKAATLVELIAQARTRMKQD